MTIVVVGLLLLLAAGPVDAADTVRTEAARLRFNVPSSWTRTPATSDTQAARFRLPAAAGDLADTDVVLFFAGEGKKPTDAQLEHWHARFNQPDGRPTKSVAEVTKRTVNGLAITTIDVSGDYVGTTKSGVRASVSGYRMLGAIIKGEGRQWVFEVVGPRATVAAERADFDALLFSLEYH